MCQKNPTFMYWDFILRYETLILIFFRAHREKKFLLYVEVLEKFTPLFFALDHVNYSRWIPVQIRDMNFCQVLLEISLRHKVTGFSLRLIINTQQFQLTRPMNKRMPL